MADIEKLGRAGEAIISNHLSSQGIKFIWSVDQYDRTKDLLVDGEKWEVKTQVPFVNRNCFSIRPDQLKKCVNAAWVYFISVPTKKKNHHSDGWVHKIEGKKMIYFHYTTRDGTPMIGIDIDQLDMHRVFKISEHECTILQRYSNSGWN